MGWTGRYVQDVRNSSERAADNPRTTAGCIIVFAQSRPRIVQWPGKCCSFTHADSRIPRWAAGCIWLNVRVNIVQRLPYSRR